MGIELGELHEAQVWEVLRTQTQVAPVGSGHGRRQLELMAEVAPFAAEALIVVIALCGIARRGGQCFGLEQPRGAEEEGFEEEELLDEETGCEDTTWLEELCEEDCSELDCSEDSLLYSLETGA